MKADRARLLRALDTAPADVRLFLLYGPDESGSRALAARIATSLGADAERVDLTGAVLKADPARLADEAASMSLFGERRYIRVENAGDESLDAVEALLEAASAGNPVVMIAGALRKDAKLLKRALADDAVLAFASYVPEGAEADRLAATLARDAGLIIRPDLARRLVAATAGDRALMAQEIEKLALYADAAPDRPREIDHDALDALGAAVDEGDLGRLVDAVMGGRLPAIDDELAQLEAEGIAGIPVIRAMLRRLMLLAPLSAEVAAGNSPSSVMAQSAKGLFWKEKDAVERQLSRWAPAALQTAIDRLIAAELAIKAPATPGTILLDAELFAIGRAAERMR
jgi:DNA polymerase-3 subunit delta